MTEVENERPYKSDKNIIDRAMSALTSIEQLGYAFAVSDHAKDLVLGIKRGIYTPAQLEFIRRSMEDSEEGPIRAYTGIEDLKK